MTFKQIPLVLSFTLCFALCGLAACDSGDDEADAPIYVYEESDDDLLPNNSADDDTSDDDTSDDDTSDDDTLDDDTSDDDTSVDDDDDIGQLYDEIEVEGQIRALVNDIAGPIIYAADMKNDAVVVINTDLNEISERISVESDPIDLDLNPNGDRLWIATSGVDTLEYIELGSRAKGTVQLNHNPVAVAVGGNGKVYAINDEENIEIVDETTQSFITEVEQNLEDWFPTPKFIEIDRSANLMYVANEGVSPSSVARIDISNDDLAILEVNEHGTLGTNGNSLSLSPDGATFVFPNGAGNGNGYTVFLNDAMDFTNVLGEFDIGTYPRQMAYDPQEEFIAGINDDPHDNRLYIMDPTSFNQINILNISEWIDGTQFEPDRTQDPLLVIANAAGSKLLIYAEDTYNDLNGHFYIFTRIVAIES